MKLFDLSINFTTATKVFEHPKEFPTRAEYKIYFPNATIDLKRFKLKKMFTQHTIEFSITLNQFKNGDDKKIILTT